LFFVVFCCFLLVFCFCFWVLVLFADNIFANVVTHLFASTMHPSSVQSADDVRQRKALFEAASMHDRVQLLSHALAFLFVFCFFCWFFGFTFACHSSLLHNEFRRGSLSDAYANQQNTSTALLVGMAESLMVLLRDLGRWEQGAQQQQAAQQQAAVMGVVAVLPPPETQEQIDQRIRAAFSREYVVPDEGKIKKQRSTLSIALREFGVHRRYLMTKFAAYGSEKLLLSNVDVGVSLLFFCFFFCFFVFCVENSKQTYETFSDWVVMILRRQLVSIGSTKRNSRLW